MREESTVARSLNIQSDFRDDIKQIIYFHMDKKWCWVVS